MRRHYANYLKGIPHIKPLRTQLVTLNTLEEIEDLLNSLNPAHFQDLSVVQEA
jgi:tRNA-dihydrouridine synthase